MTHKQLVEIAFKWVHKNGRVGVVFKELVSAANEIPDVIGFDSGESIIVECKVSRSDFLSNKKKYNNYKGMGVWRFFCCPRGLIKVEDLPEKWGLIYVNEKGKAIVEYDCRRKKVKLFHVQEWQYKENPEGFQWVIREADENKFEIDHRSERNIMYSALRRLYLRGFCKHIYDKPENQINTAEQNLFS